MGSWVGDWVGGLFEDVRRQGIKPTIVTYSALTSTCEKETDLTQAKRLL